MVGKVYDSAFIKRILELFDSGISQYRLSVEYNLSETTIKRWRKDRDKYLKPNSKERLHSITRPKPRGSVVMAIPDLHCPFEHPDALAFLKAVRDKIKPDYIVNLGDEIDAHAFSRFPHDPDGYSAGHELSEAVKHLLPFYLEFPEVLVCESNHTVRGHKKAFEAGLPAAFMVHISKVLNAPDGWVWKSRHEIDDVLYIHGEGKSGFNAHIQFMRAYKRSVVIGHIHSYAAVSHEGNLFAVNSGCLIDVDAYCFKYAKHMPIPVNLGCSIISNGKKAAFIPMILDENKRWVGHL